ncbi:DUF3489 domain-containing protein [Rhizobium ruizarguesonis]
MKSYSVKSNAKRFARSIAAKHPQNIEAIEPVETSIIGMGWFPAVRIIGDVTDGFKVMVFDSYGADAVIHGLDTGEVVNEAEGIDPAILAEGDAGVYSIPAEDMSELADASGLKAAFDAVEPVTTGDLEAVDLMEPRASTDRRDVFTSGIRGGKTALQQAFVEEMLDAGHTVAVVTSQGDVDVRGAGAAKDITPTLETKDEAHAADAKTWAAAALLPPRVDSSREEIEARRAERRQRIDAEKAAGTFGAKPEKISKKKIVLDLMKREDGATQKELEDATGWQRHTLRGYIAGTLRKQLGAVGFAIECSRGSGEVPTRYFIEPVKAAGKGGEA